MEESLDIMVREEMKNPEVKFLSPSDFRAVIDMTQNAADRISHEDAFEMVIKKKLQAQHPDFYQKIYSQRTMRL
jgi:hypothetical protein